MPVLKRPPIVRQTFWALFGLSLLTLLVMIWIAAQSARDLIYNQSRSELEDRAKLIRNQLVLLCEADSLFLQQPMRADNWLKALAAGHQLRITLIDSAGIVLGDTHENPLQMDNHANRPEVISALSGELGSSDRYSATLEHPLLYVALPVLNTRPAVVLRTSMARSAITEEIGLIQKRLMLGALLALVIAALLGLWNARRISRPLETMRLSADRISAGELDHRLPVEHRSMELVALATSVNQMALKLADQIHRLDHEKRERDALLTGMDEGVIALDRGGRIQSCNPAAERLLGLEEFPVGARLKDLLSDPELSTLIEQGWAGRIEVEHAFRGHMLRIHAVVLEDAGSSGKLLLAVFSDVTHIHQAEEQRKQFVSNVSHELRTPVTAIQGFVETLLDGALDDKLVARKHLQIIERQAIRLNAIIEDLLTLARMERLQAEQGLQVQSVNLCEIVSQVIQDHSLIAQKAGVEVHFSCDCNSAMDHHAELDAHLYERAVINLLINALRYGGEKSRVELRLQTEAQDGRAGYRLDVIDQGCGIAAENQPRIFERFFVVDKARSRSVGGTGLGLAIVKHAAMVHDGLVGVESEVDKGSRFWIWIPVEQVNQA